MNAISKITRAKALSVVDELGSIKAAIAALVDQETALKQKLVAMGVGVHTGDLFDATVTLVSRETLDMAAVREKLSPQFIARHTKTTTSPTVRVVARVQRSNAA